MEKINFQDGQLVEPGYVEIDGVKHQITEAEYEGNTPLSSFVLNKMQDNIETELTNIEQEGIIVSPTEPTENRRKVWMQKGKNLSKINEVNNISSTSNSKVRVKVKENTVYTISCKKERIEGVTITNNQAYMFRWIHCYNSNNELLETFSAIDTLSTLITSNSNSKTIVTPPNTSYIEIDFRNDNGDNNANTRAFEIMVEQNQTVTSYEPYIEPKTYILNDNNVYEEFMKKEEEIYSTEEQIVGKWIDGKTLYRKVIQFNIPNSASDGTKAETTTDLNIANIDFIKIKEAIIFNSTDYRMLPTYSGNNWQYVFFAYINKSLNQLIARSNASAFSNYTKAYAVLEYTKTTD